MPPVRKPKIVKAAKQPQSKPSEKNVVVSGQLEKKIKKQQKNTKEKRGIVFIKHLPHGFFEEQLKSYFQQFGRVTRLRLSRSKRTGGSKGYAFVEFEHPEVAEVAADTMDNYLMFQKLVKASYIPPEQQKYNYFKTGVRKVRNKAGKEIYVSHKTAAIQRKAVQHNDWSEDNYQKRTLKNLKKIKKLSKKYAHLGIDFSNILIEPEKITDENNQIESKTESASKSSKSIRGKAKSKELAKKSESKLSKTIKKDVQLADLLGNTINDDPDDEDYIAMPESDDESAEEEQLKDVNNSDDDDDDDDDASSSTDEETYGFNNSSDDETTEISKTKQAKSTHKNKASLGKSLKGSRVDRFEQLIKRKPQTGAVQKAKKLSKSIPATKGKKSSIQVAAAKDMMKSLPTGKTHINAKTKQMGKKQKLRK